MGHITKYCPLRKEEYKRKNNKTHHVYATEEEEAPRKLAKKEIKEYVLYKVNFSCGLEENL